NAGHPAARDYFEAHAFKEVWLDLWIEPEFLARLVADVPTPRVTLEAQPPRIAPGQCTVVRWDVANADTVLLERNPVAPRSDLRSLPNGDHRLPPIHLSSSRNVYGDGP